MASLLQDLTYGQSQVNAMAAMAGLATPMHKYFCIFTFRFLVL